MHLALGHSCESCWLPFGNCQRSSVLTFSSTRATCDSYGPKANDGSLGYETLDAATFAEWEVDYLKYEDSSLFVMPALALENNFGLTHFLISDAFVNIARLHTYELVGGTRLSLE